MFTTFKQRLVLGIFVVVILSIPIGAYVISEQQSKQSEETSTDSDRSISLRLPVTSVRPSSSPAGLDLSSLATDIEDSLNTTSPTSTDSGIPVMANSFGPTLEFKITLEGRPLSNQSTKMFVGITEAVQTGSPKYLLSFNIDIPASGEFKNLSLAGLTAGQNYKAYLKSPAQLATSSAFLMADNVSYLNSSQALNLITGDLNEDNTINSADYSLAKAVFGTNENSATWNPNIDFNKDGVINSVDLRIISKNLGKTGDSGIWQSTPQTGFASIRSPLSIGTPSSTIAPATSSATPDGYWMWVPY